MADQDTFMNGVEILDSSVATSSTASLYTYGGISIFNTATATDLNNGGSFLTLGGVSISKNTLIGGDTRILSTTVSTNTSTGSLIMNGGVAIQGSVYGNFSSFNNIQAITSASIPNLITNAASIANLSLTSFNPTNITVVNLVSTTASIGTLIAADSSLTNLTTTNLVSTNISASNAAATNVSTTNLTVSSYASIAGAQFVPFLSGTWIDMPAGTTASAIGTGGPGANPWIGYAGNSGYYFTNSVAGDICYRNNTGNLLFGTSAGLSAFQISNNIITVQSTVNSTNTSTGSFIVNGGVGIKKDIYVAGNTNILSSTVSSNTSTGALIVSGGLGIGGALNIGGNATISGNLTVNGTTVTVNSTTVSINDNVIVLNSGPTGTADGGILINRFQASNNAGTGDVVNDTIAFSGTIQNSSLSTVVFPSGASAVDSFYNNYWIKITSGLANNNVRQVVSYVGSTRTATLSSNLTGLPSSSVDTFNIYGNLYVSSYFKESTNEYTMSYTASTPGSTITDVNYANLKIANLTAALVSTSNLIATNMTVANFTLPANVTFSNLVSTNISSGALRVTGNVDLSGGLTSTTNFTATLGTIATLLSTNVIATNLSAASSILTNTNVTNFTSVNSNVTAQTVGSIIATNINVTNLTAPSLAVTNFITTNATATNLFITNITVPNIFTTNVTTKNFLVAGNTGSNIVYIDCQGSATNPGILLFKNTAGSGDLRIYGDGGDIQWIGGGGRALQMGAYHEIRLRGGSTSTAQLTQIAGSNSNFNTIVENTNDSIALRVYANGTQTQDLTQWTSAGGSTVYTRIDRLGNLQITSTADSISAVTGGSITTSGGVSIAKSLNVGATANATDTSSGALIVSGGAGFNGDIYANNIFSNGAPISSVFGSEYNYTALSATTGTTAITYTLRTSLTTGSLVGGTYKVTVGYTYYSNSSTTSDGTFLGFVDATALTTGTLFHEYVNRSSRNTFRIPIYDTARVVLSAGVHRLSLVWKSQTAGQAVNISDAKLELFRIA